MNIVLDEMANALIKALKPNKGGAMLTELAKYRRELVSKRFYEKCDEEERRWQKDKKREQMEESKSKGFKNQWHK